MSHQMEDAKISSSVPIQPQVFVVLYLSTITIERSGPTGLGPAAAIPGASTSHSPQHRMYNSQLLSSLNTKMPLH